MRALFRLALVLPALLLAACETPPSRTPLPDLTYGHLPPFRLEVAVVNIVEGYAPPLAPPHVEHLFPTTPAAAAARWARDRLQPVGRTGEARFTILEASVVEVPLPVSGGIVGALSREQAERYDAVLEVRLDIVNAGGLRAGSVTARAIRSQTVPEGITLNERERVWFALTEALMQSLNAELEANIRRHLAAFLR